MHCGQDRARKAAARDRVLADAGRCDHIVHLNQNQDFLNHPLCQFAAALAYEEGIILGAGPEGSHLDY